MRNVVGQNRAAWYSIASQDNEQQCKPTTNDERRFRCSAGFSAFGLVSGTARLDASDAAECAQSPRRLHPQRIARFDRAHGTPERDRGPVQLGSVDTVRTVTAPNLTVMAVICVQGPGGLGPCEEVVPADDGRVFSG